MDNRNIFSNDSSPFGANNDILIICDHSSNDLKGLKGTRLEEDKYRSQDAYDINAADFAGALSERFECMAVLTSFSKLIIDPSLPMCSQTLVPNFYSKEKEQVEILSDNEHL